MRWSGYAAKIFLSDVEARAGLVRVLVVSGDFFEARVPGDQRFEESEERSALSRRVGALGRLTVRRDVADIDDAERPGVVTGDMRADLCLRAAGSEVCGMMRMDHHLASMTTVVSPQSEGHTKQSHRPHSRASHLGDVGELEFIYFEP